MSDEKIIAIVGELKKWKQDSETRKIRSMEQNQQLQFLGEITAIEKIIPILNKNQIIISFS